VDKNGALVATATSWKGSDKPEVALDANNEVLVAGKGNVYRFDNGAAVIAQLKSKATPAATGLVGPIERSPVAVDEAVVDDANATPVGTPQKIDIAETTGRRRFDPSGAAFVWIPAGGFMMGSPTSERDRYSEMEQQRRVEITQGFYMSATEVTQAQYEMVMGSNPSNFKGADHPVEVISWLDAVQFCNKLSARENLSPAYRIGGDSVTWDDLTNGYRLPTEAEWEYACRAGTTAAYYTGGSEADLAHAGWYGGNQRGGTRPVGKKTPNAWGLYDMHGNVWEWCWDPQGSYRVCRGGSWNYYAGNCRSAFRSWEDPSGAFIFLGFRVVRSSAP
jgi:formylglycine-generating enzyme required for sulfatase activity